MEIKPFLRVVLNETAFLTLLGYNQIGRNLGELSSLKVFEIASCQELRIIRHGTGVGLTAEDILLLEAVSLSESLHNVGKHILKQHVLFCIGAKLLHRVRHLDDDRGLTLGREEDNVTVRLLQLGVKTVEHTFFGCCHYCS